MQWTCKYCTFCAEKRGQLLKHYHLKHGSFARTSAFLCLHRECLCVFKSFNSLKVHLASWHTLKDPGKAGQSVFHCQLCDFVEPCTENDFFTHLWRPLKLKQIVACSYQDCQFQSNVYSTFNAHKSKQHRNERTFKPDIVSETSDGVLSVPAVNLDIQFVNDVAEADVELEVSEVSEDVNDLERQLEHNVAALLLKMSAILNVTENALQDVIEQINQIYVLSQPLLQSSVHRILRQHCGDVDDSLVSEIVRVVIESNVFLKFTSAEGSRSTVSKGESFISREFSVVMPEELLLQNKQTFVYVLNLKMLQTLLNNGEIFRKGHGFRNKCVEGMQI